ncbi:hypothetical protein DFQ30_001965 [Apophysomyces sp. BC1015]|nr:hypothetical protein DFQ30_001965 [Apophysomyces sp. BC1015]
MEDQRMEQRVVLVTGAARGLGAVIAVRFHAAGYRVALADVALDAAAAQARAIDNGTGTAYALKLDVKSKRDFEAAREQVADRWGRVDVLVNNAAATQIAAPMEITAEQFDEVISINLRSVLFGCQNGGSATGAHYAAAKGGALTLTKVFARELAAHGVTVNAISPGPLDLPIVHEIVPPDKLGQMIAGIPVGQLGSPDYVADVALLLAAEHASSANGACWDINGGLYMR